MDKIIENLIIAMYNLILGNKPPISALVPYEFVRLSINKITNITSDFRRIGW